jgi:hypothetical protein
MLDVVLDSILQKIASMAKEENTTQPIAMT